MPQGRVVRCHCGCGQVLFRSAPTGDSIIIRCNKGAETQVGMRMMAAPVQSRQR